MFQLRDFNSISIGMINHAKATQDQLTDFTQGSVARTILESSAIEIDEFYQRVFSGILEAIPTAVYRAFSFDTRLPAYARGTVKLTFTDALSAPLPVPAGTVFSASSGNSRYIAESAVIASPGDLSLNVPVICSSPGSSGNIAANAITKVSGLTLPTGATVGNLPITGGDDGETDTQKINRFNAFIKSLVRGTPYAVLNAARFSSLTDTDGNITEYVSRAGYSEGRGYAGVYIWSGGGAPTLAMLNHVQSLLDGTPATPGWRPCGIKVTVYPMQEVSVNVSLTIWRDPVITKSAAENAVLTAVALLLASVDNNSTLYVAQITEAALSVPGILRAVSGNTENIPVGFDSVLKPGNIAITWGNA